MSLLSEIGNAVRGFYCSTIASSPVIQEQFWSQGGFPPNLFQSPLGEFWRSAARALGRQWCPTPDPNRIFGRDLSKGNCPVDYNIQFAVEIYPDNCVPFPDFFGATVRGPLGALSFINPNQNNPRCGGVNTFSDVVIRDGNGSDRLIYTDGTRRVGAFRFLSVTRVDGLPDTCPSPVPPPVPLVFPIPFTQNVTYINRTGNQVTVPVVFGIFSPQLNVNNEIVIPVEFQIGIEGTVQVEVNVTRDWETTPSPSDDFRPIPPGEDPSDYTDEPPPPGPPLPLPEPSEPPNKATLIIRAVIVEVTGQNPNLSPIGTPGEVSIEVPDLGLIQFQIQTASGLSDTEDIRVKTRRQFIPVPWDGGAVGWRSSPRQGLEFQITPVYRRVERPITEGA